MSILKNPLILSLDVDTKEDAYKIIDHVGDLVGGLKIGPRLTYKYGSALVEEMAEVAPVFVDNKYFDIFSTMVAAVRATFAAGASLTTVHALAGREALTQLAALEIELNRVRSFKILAVTVLTSWEENSFPANFHSWSVENHVRSLAQLVYSSGLRGLVCSGHELELLEQQDFFKVVPGIRLSSDAVDDQKRVMTAKQAIKGGAQALVVGRPILKSNQPRSTILEILESC